MPWTAESFVKKHNHNLSGDTGEKGAHIANAILREGKDEASAIRIANWQVSKAPKSTGRYKSFRAR